MKVFILCSVLAIAAGQLNIQMPVEWLQQPQQQPQQNNWDFRRPVEQQPQENNWDFRRPVEQPQNSWNQQPQWNDPWNQPQNNWNQPQQDPWNMPTLNQPGQWWQNQQPIRVPPQPVETEPWLLRPETRCPQPQENSYSWALIIPHFRDQQQLTVCMGGVGIPFACPTGFVYVQAEQSCVGNYQRFPFALENQEQQPFSTE